MSRAALVVALALAAPRPAAAEPAWFVPDHAKLQLAGDIGFLSPGVGWELGGREVHADVFVGWVPAAVGGDDITSVTGKLSWTPWRVRAGARRRIEPLRAGVQVTYTFGSEYFVSSPGRYPAGYYDVPTALRAGVAVGGGVVRKLRGERELGVYYEAVALDLMLRTWLENRAVLSARDVVSLAIGTRLRF